VNRFAALLDGLLFTPSRNGKLRLMREYFADVPDPERGWALAALTGELVFDAAKPAQVRALAAARVDPALLEWSYDFVGDLAETVSLIWPETAGAADLVPSLAEIVEQLKGARRSEVGCLLELWLDALDSTGRWALLKLVTGSLRIGVSARLAKTALAEWGGVEIDRIEEIWHALTPPFDALFDWLEGRRPAPQTGGLPTFCPLMLAQPLDDVDIEGLDPGDYLAEWKWDGIRVQLAARGSERRLYSRSGDEIGAAFPEVLAAMPAEVTLDGELLVLRDGEVASFNDLQQRLNRSAQLVNGTSWAELRELRDGARERGIEGLMLKRADSAYVAGRPKGPWFKWKRGALTLDTVLMYAQRGHGKRSSFYSDYTFGAWSGSELVPVGKAYSGFTDEELHRLDRWVRNNTVQRYGPVREVTPEVVLEIAFDSVHRSTRHKSGVAMRFPRIHRIRWDKPVGEADTIEALEKLLPPA